MPIQAEEKKKIRKFNLIWDFVNGKQVKMFCSSDFDGFECVPKIFTGGQYVTIERGGAVVPIRINNILKIQTKDGKRTYSF